MEDVCDRQLVLLGELPSHGEARAFQTKAAIVKGLVEQCGFSVVLFEAGLYDFLGVEKATAERRATFRQFNRAIGRFWWTEGLAEWRRWLFGQAQAGALLIGGLDDQPSMTSDYARAVLPDLVASVLPDDLSTSCRTAVDVNLHWRYNDAHPFDETERMLLERCTRQAAEAVRGELASEEATLTPQQMLLANLASYYSRQLASAPDRDAVMHRNVLWHRARQADTSKVVVWTATVHAARQQGLRPTAPLGAYLAAQWGDEMAAIGFTAYSGASSMAGRPSNMLPEAPSGSLEALATADGGAIVYLDASALHSAGDVLSRLYGPFTSAEWATHFDGVVVVREEVPPVFGPWD